MDKIWYRNPSKWEVIGHCGGDEKKRMTAQNRQKSNAKNKTKKNQPKHTQKDLNINPTSVIVKVNQTNQHIYVHKLRTRTIILTIYSITHSFIKSINHIYYHQLRTANILNILKFIYRWIFCKKTNIICSLYIYTYIFITLNGILGRFATILGSKRIGRNVYRRNVQVAKRPYTTLHKGGNHQLSDSKMVRRVTVSISCQKCFQR